MIGALADIFVGFFCVVPILFYAENGKEMSDIMKVE